MVWQVGCATLGFLCGSGRLVRYWHRRGVLGFPLHAMPLAERVLFPHQDPHELQVYRGCAIASSLILSAFRKFCAMVVVTENVHPRGLNFFSQRKVMILRDVQGLSFKQIAQKVQNLAGKRPSPRTCCQYYHSFSASAGRRKAGYKKCGRSAWKLTPAVKKWIIQTLKKRRCEGACTCASLRLELAREWGIAAEVCTIRKYIQSQGFKWLPRGQKRKYTQQQMQQRYKFAHSVVALGPARLRQKLSFSMDGCVLTLPPRDLTDRLNFLRQSQTHMWRLKSERLSPKLAGQDMFGKQATLERSIPLWAGISAGGFAAVSFHAKKKLTKVEWVSALRAGKLVDAVKSLGPVKPNGPWHLLCDNEAFLNAADCKAEYRKLNLRLWRIPAKSPDLNPVELFWSYLRNRLRRLDLSDALRKRPALSKMAYKARVRSVLASAHAQAAAKRIAKGYIKTCKEIVRRGGAASSG